MKQNRYSAFGREPFDRYCCPSYSRAERQLDKIIGAGKLMERLL
jgi:hypothetical protein